MTNLERIQEAEARVAVLQGRLDSAQQVLQKAEKVAVVGESIKRRAFVVVLVVSLAATGLLIGWIMKKRRDRIANSAED